MSGRALVTGATGMLGGYIARRLADAGWSVRGLARSAGSARCLEAAGLSTVTGRLEDPASLLAAVRGCDAVFNAAAAIGTGGPGEPMEAVNVGGTANLVAAAQAAGARLVHVSSTAVYGRARYGVGPTDEERALPELPHHDRYGRSKQEAERLVLDAVRRGRLWGTIVRPPVMYGVGDRQFAPRVGPVLERGLFPLIGGGRTTLTLVHASNVADGAILAARHDGACGEVFLLAEDFPVTVQAFVRGAAAGLGRKVSAPSVPHWAGRAGFAALAWGVRASGRGDLARHARGTLEMLTRDNPFTSRKAREVLGWAPAARPETGLPEAFRWWSGSRPSAAGREAP